MKFRADLHIHSVLSPCGDIEMSPSAIIQKAKERELNLIGLTDHNSTLNAAVTQQIGAANGIAVLMGAEVTTKEEIHCLSFMPNLERLAEFQKFLDSKVIFFENDTDKFGYQFVVDAEENIIDEVPHLLINALDLTMLDLQKKVYELGGIFIPAHVDRSSYSISSQLVFVPDHLKFQALELSFYARRNKFFDNFPWFSDYNFIQSSDAHYINDIGKISSLLEMDSFSFDNFKNSLHTGEQIIL